MEFASITLDSTVWFINRPPNNVKDLEEGTIVGKTEFVSGKGKTFVTVEVEDESGGPDFATRFKVSIDDVYDVKSDAIDALEAEYTADGTTKTDYISQLRGE